MASFYISLQSSRRLLSLVRIRLQAHERAVDGPKVGAVIFQIQSTDRRAPALPAGYTPVAITCPASGRPETAISLTHTVSADSRMTLCRHCLTAGAPTAPEFC
jgi:hypothetical protein